MNTDSDDKKLILVAEDDDISYTFLELVLTSSGYKVMHTVNGEDTVEACKEHPETALILMDIKMPGMNGLEATEKIREFNKSVPIIAQTAYALAGDSEKTLEAGCNDYISKPVTAQILLGKIENLLE